MQSVLLRRSLYRGRAGHSLGALWGVQSADAVGTSECCRKEGLGQGKGGLEPAAAPQGTGFLFSGVLEQWAYKIK